MKDAHKYDDIIRLPHHVSARHPQMSIHDRAAQFSPFAALTGHDAAIRETERLTEEWVELDEDSKEQLDERLQMIREHLAERPEITFTFFQPDERKQGGAYRTITGKVKKIDEYEHRILLEDGTALMVEHLVSIEGNPGM
ncbi:MAG: YolD-like family protein [Agathobacter sp.]|nr:YolD-like family protein [Agathobacter sp.]